MAEYNFTSFICLQQEISKAKVRLDGKVMISSSSDK